MASASWSGGITGGSNGPRRARWASTRGATRRTSSIGGLVAPVQPGEGGSGAAQRRGRRAGPRRRRRGPTGWPPSITSSPTVRRLAAAQRCAQRARRSAANAGSPPGIAVEREPAAHGLDALVEVGRRRDVDAQPEAVEQLWAQLALLGVHRADEHEAGRVAVRDAVALDDVLAGDGDVEQHVDEVVGEQVDLVDVEDAAVGGGEQAGPERQLAAGRARR